MTRFARPADIPFLVALSGESATAAQWDASHYRAAFARGNPTERVILIVEDDSQPAGFLVAKPLGPEWELENIVVAPQSRRRGLAQGLLRDLASLARNHAAEAIFLEVRESNIAARKLYEKLGFALSGRRPAYYSNPDEPAVLYSLNLAQQLANPLADPR